jgi:hypothetical protein
VGETGLTGYAILDYYNWSGSCLLHGSTVQDDPV